MAKSKAGSGMKRLFTLFSLCILSAFSPEMKNAPKPIYNPVRGVWQSHQKFTRYTNGEVRDIVSTYEFRDDGKCMFTYDGDTVIPLKWEMVGLNHLRLYYSGSGFKEYRISYITTKELRLTRKYINYRNESVTEVRLFTRVINKP